MVVPIVIVVVVAAAVGAVSILIEGESTNYNVQSFVYNLIYESTC